MNMAATSSAAPHRARIMGRRHMVASGHYLATQAAFQILEAGGNAIDAGVAGGITLGIVQSEYVGFGGVAPIMLRLASTGETWTISGLGCWPAATDVEWLRAQGGIPRGLRRTVTPAAPDSWITALERFGTMSYGEVASSALRFARDGFPTTSLMSAIIGKARKEYSTWESNAAIYLPRGEPPAPGDLFVQSDLAGVIAYMIDEEKAVAGRSREAGLAAARAAFYRGDIAKKMVDYHAENDGWLAAADLADFRVEVAPPVKISLAGADLYTCGPWCQGPLLAQAMGLLEGSDLAGLGHNSTAYVHRLVEVLKLAYADRQAYFGDPNFIDVPLDRLLSEDYLAERRTLIDNAAASPGIPPSGVPAAPGELAPMPATPESEISQIDTSYICVVDGQGNVFSATPSDGSAAAPVIPGLGFVPSSRGAQSWLEEGHPAVAGPGRRPRLTPSPALAEKPDEWIMPFGSPGNDVQPQAMLQTFLNLHLWKMTPQEAVEAPRFATFSYPRSTDPHTYDPGLLMLENRMSDETEQGLRDLGHDVRRWTDWEYAAGGVCTILADQRNGMLEGGSDPRRPTAVAGW